MDYVKETGNKKYDINGTYRDLAGLASVVAGALSLPADIVFGEPSML